MQPDDGVWSGNIIKQDRTFFFKNHAEIGVVRLVLDLFSFIRKSLKASVLQLSFNILR